MEYCQEKVIKKENIISGQGLLYFHNIKCLVFDQDPNNCL